MKQHMQGHFTAVVAVERAIVHGHLDIAKKQATWLTEHDDVVPAGSEPFVAELKEAAAAVAAATDLPTAGAQAARLGRACSRCHDANAAVIAFAWEPAPELTDCATPGQAGCPTVLQVQMRRHQWAAARLWEGLVGPSDEMWSQGTGVLAVAELDVLAAGRGQVRGDVQALAANVRRLAGQAATTTDRDRRAELYGQLLSTCAGCHALVRPDPVPAP